MSSLENEPANPCPHCGQLLRERDLLSQAACRHCRGVIQETQKTVFAAPDAARIAGETAAIATWLESSDEEIAVDKSGEAVNEFRWNVCGYPYDLAAVYLGRRPGIVELRMWWTGLDIDPGEEEERIDAALADAHDICSAHGVQLWGMMGSSKLIGATSLFDIVRRLDKQLFLTATKRLAGAVQAIQAKYRPEES